MLNVIKWAQRAAVKKEGASEEMGKGHHHQPNMLINYSKASGKRENFKTGKQPNRSPNHQILSECLSDNYHIILLSLSATDLNCSVSEKYCLNTVMTTDGVEPH